MTRTIRTKPPFNKTAWLKAALRRASYRWPSRYLCKAAARVARGKYKCASCAKILTTREICVDHIDPVVDPKVGFVDWNTYIERLFCNIENLQCLCKPCHKTKTKSEALQRKRKRASEKQEERANSGSKSKKKTVRSHPRKTSQEEGMRRHSGENEKEADI